MFTQLATHHVNEIQISRRFYNSTYDHVRSISQKGMQQNIFGARAKVYVTKKIEEDIAFFETPEGKDLADEMSSIVHIDVIQNESGRKYKVRDARVQIVLHRACSNVSVKRYSEL